MTVMETLFSVCHSFYHTDFQNKYKFAYMMCLLWTYFYQHEVALNDLVPFKTSHYYVRSK